MRARAPRPCSQIDDVQSATDTQVELDKVDPSRSAIAVVSILVVSLTFCACSRRVSSSQPDRKREEGQQGLRAEILESAGTVGEKTTLVDAGVESHVRLPPLALLPCVVNS